MIVFRYTGPKRDGEGTFRVIDFLIVVSDACYLKIHGDGSVQGDRGNITSAARGVGLWKETQI